MQPDPSKRARKKAVKPKVKQRREKALAGSRKIAIPEATFERWLKAGDWPNMEGDKSKSFFSYKGAKYWPMNVVRHEILALEVVTKPQWKGRTHDGPLRTPGKLFKIKGRTYVVKRLAEFVRAGSPLDD